VSVEKKKALKDESSPEVTLWIKCMV